MLVGKKCVFDSDIWVIVSEPMIYSIEDDFLSVVVIVSRGFDLLAVDIDDITIADEIL